MITDFNKRFINYKINYNFLLKIWVLKKGYNKGMRTIVSSRSSQK